MALAKISKDFGKPLGKPDTYYVQCVVCDRTEGQFITAVNRLSRGIGSAADDFRERGWRFESEGWTCPACCGD